MAAIGACAGFGAICGSSMATAATMAQVALPELKRAGYARQPVGTGLLAAGGTLGILIPPSIVLVIYAILAEQNIAKLFAAAFVPGILAALGYMAGDQPSIVRLRPDAGRAGGASCPGPSAGGPWVAVWPVLLIFIGRHRRHLFSGLYSRPTEGARLSARWPPACWPG